MINQIKRNSYRLSLLGLGTFVVVGGMFLTNGLAKEERHEQHHSVQRERVIGNNMDQQQKREFINHIAQLAHQGKMINSGNVKIGSTSDQIIQAWGQPDERVDSDQGAYNYNDRNLFLYVNDGRVGPINTVIQIDYSGNGLQTITKEDVHRALGNPLPTMRGAFEAYPAGSHQLLFQYDQNQHVETVRVITPLS